MASRQKRLNSRADSPRPRDVAPLADALGVVGVGGAVAPLGGGGGEGFVVGVVGAGVDGEEGANSLAVTPRVVE